MIKVYLNCRTTNTGLSKPHTLYLGENRISIIHTNKLNEESVRNHYLKTLNMQKFATATDTYGETYTVYVQFPKNPFYSIVAIPDKPVKRGYY